MDITERLHEAADHLNGLDLYPRPLNVKKVRVHHAPWFFTMKHNKKYCGFAMHNRILFKEPLDKVSEEVLRHELCHVWQMQNHPFKMPLSYLNYRRGYWNNPYEIEACNSMY